MSYQLILNTLITPLLSDRYQFIIYHSWTCMTSTKSEKETWKITSIMISLSRAIFTQFHKLSENRKRKKPSKISTISFVLNGKDTMKVMFWLKKRTWTKSTRLKSLSIVFTQSSQKVKSQSFWWGTIWTSVQRLIQFTLKSASRPSKIGSARSTKTGEILMRMRRSTIMTTIAQKCR